LPSPAAKRGEAKQAAQGQDFIMACVGNDNASPSGKRCIVTSNSKTKMVNLAAAIRDEFPQRKTIVITSDTRLNEAEVRQFIGSPAKLAEAYHAVFASPSIGTGVDIAFPGKAQVFDVVFGFCEAQITTHLEFDQQLARVRHPGEVKVWVNPRRFHFETEFDVVKRDALERSLFKNVLIGYADTGEPEYQENDAFLEMASLILSEQRASKNDLKANFIRHKQKQGFRIEHVNRDEDLSADGLGVLVSGRHLHEEALRQTILAANTLTETEFVRLRDALRAGEFVPASEKIAYERTSLELFYGSPATADLIRLDGRGRFRASVRLFELVFEQPDLAKLNFHSFERRRFVTTETGKATTLLMLLRLTPLMSEGRLNSEAVIQQSDLAEFTKASLKHKAVIETHLGIDIRRDVKAKPVQQLGRILRLLGLRLERCGSNKREGQKTYQYRLELQSLASLKAIVQARKAQGQRQFGGRLFGCPEPQNPIDESADGDN